MCSAAAIHPVRSTICVSHDVYTCVDFVGSGLRQQPWWRRDACLHGRTRRSMPPVELRSVASHSFILFSFFTGRVIFFSQKANHMFFNRGCHGVCRLAVMRRLPFLILVFIHTKSIHRGLGMQSRAHPDVKRVFSPRSEAEWRRSPCLPDKYIESVVQAWSAANGLWLESWRWKSWPSY